MPKLAKATDARPGAHLPAGMVRVWDPVVRLFHWSLVVSVAIAWFSANHNEALHTRAGYVAAGLIAVRLIWGLIGSRYARLSTWVRGPRAVLRYLRDILTGTEARFLGHNPAGGAMILALMTVVAALGLTGWMMFTPTWYGVDWVTHLHGLIADVLAVLVMGHLAGVALASLRHRENLVVAMLTGKKRASGPDDPAL